MKYRKNSVKGQQRGKKYSEAVRTACMCDLLVVDNLSDVAKKHGVPESTLRTWKAKAEKLGPEGEKSLWAQARDEQVKQIALKAAQGARLGTELIVHRLEAGQRNMQRCDEIDRILLGSEKSEGLVLLGDTAVDEQRQRTKLGRELEERLRDERQQRDRIIPGDFALANMTRTLTSVSAKGAGEQGAVQAGGKRYEDYLDQLAGDEW